MDLLAAPGTVFILAVTVATTVAAFSRPALFNRLMLYSTAIIHGNEFWRLFTTSLVHADWIHLAFNAFTLLSFGSFLEGAIGTWRFVLLYVLGVVVGSTASLVQFRDNPTYRAVGASGGVCAVIGCATALFPTMGMYVFIIPIAIPAWIMGAGFIAYSIVGLRRQTDNIGHTSHLGGEVFGLGFALAFYPGAVLAQWWYVVIMLLAGFIAWMFVKRGGRWTM